VEKILNVLEENDIEITDEIKNSLNDLVEEENNTKDPLNQDEINEMVKEQLDQERTAYENEIEKLKTEMRELVDPEKVEEYESKIENLEKSKDNLRSELIKDYELKMAAVKNEVNDLEYFEYLVEKNKVKEKLQLNDENIPNVTDENGKKVGVQKIIADMKDNKPDLFGGGEAKNTSGPTNPAGSGELDEQRRENSKKIAEEMGYAN